MTTSFDAPLDDAPYPWNKRKREPSPIKIKDDALLGFATHLSPIDPTGTNVVFSPLSLRTLLSLVVAGASASTAEQLLCFLNSDSIEDLNAFSFELISETLADASVHGGPKISFANGVWIQEGYSLEHSFKQVVSNVYKTEIHESDFTRPRKIESKANAWAKDKTHGLIHEIIPRGSVTKRDRLILMNALYFKGVWPQNYFNVKDTKDYKFHLLDGSSIKVPCMTNISSRRRHSIGTFEDLKVLHLDYVSGDSKTCFTMHILLPDSLDGLAALAKRVGSEPGFLDRHLNSSSTKLVKFRIPKFKISLGFKASETLKQLGITSLFEKGSVSEMVNSGQELYVNDIFHKAFIEVNEQGAEVAAVMSGRLCCGLGTPQPLEKVNFVVDHPFMFVIREKKSGAVLFLGHVLNPLEE